MLGSGRPMCAAVLAAIVLAGCATSTSQSVAASAAPATSGARPLSPAEQAKADSGRPAYTRADVRFMQGMIGHHSQAVVMAGWAPSHGASSGLRVLAERIVVAQRDEIAFMQRWLGERHEEVPDADAMMAHAGMDMPGMDMSAPLMPGMLTPEQMSELSRSRGAEFDRLFLTFMIQHHQGALTMVEQLFASPGAGQDDRIFKFASDVTADQTTEIQRMQGMLARESGSPP